MRISDSCLIIHKNFEFSQTFKFIVVKKYSRLISDCEVFRDDTISEIEKETECNFCLRQVFLNLINYVGCKPVLAHLLFSRRLYNQNKPCTMCTRMICCSQEHSKILMKLRCISIPELLVDASDNLKKCF